MSLLHLEAGSKCPPLSPGTLRIYSMKYCPYAELTRLVLTHKNIPHEVVNINLVKKPEWYFEKNPLGKVPCLEKDGKLIFDSAICNAYLDTMYPQNKVIPDDPYERAQMQMWMERFVSKAVSPIATLGWGGDDPEKVPEAQKALKPFEELLGDGRQFFGGDNLNLLDIRMWPVMEKVDYAKKRGFDIIPNDQFPRLQAWKERMWKTPAVANGGGMDMVNYEKFSRKESNYDVGVTAA